MPKLNLRQSGRTTTMLREAEEAKREGHSVIIVAPSHYIRDQIIMLARGKGMLSPDGVLDRRYDFVTTTEIMAGRKRGVDAQVFCDHTVQETMATEKLLALSIEVQMISRSFLQPEAQEAAERWSFTSF